MFPITLKFGPVYAPFYEGLYFMLAILLAALWSFRRWKARGLSQDAFSTVLTGVIAGAILGGRLSHFLFWDTDLLLSDPLALLRIWQGGISVTGGIVGGALGAWLAAKLAKASFWSVSEAAAPAVLLGQAAGRIGCFLNGDAFGLPTSLPWGTRFARFATAIPSLKRDMSIPGPAWRWCLERGLVGREDLRSVPMHPTQLYEGALDLVLLALLLLALRRLPAELRGKAALLIMGGGYALIRFCMEFLRADHGDPLWAGMTSLQFVLLAVALAGAALFTFLLARTRAK